MTYLDYIVFFEKRDHVQAFSGNATRLYLKLLHLANLAGWPEELAKPDPYVAAVCGFSINTMKDCRAQLVAGGLLSATSGGTGRNAATTYQLLNPSKSDALSHVNPSKSDGFRSGNSVNPSKSDAFGELNPSENPSNFDTLNIDKEKESSSAASAATAPDSLSGKKPATKKPSTKGASHEGIAALPPPFDGADFAEAWRTFYTTNTKQAGKNLSAFELMLKKLAKYPEAFAVLMLERAIMGNWQGVEHGGTPRDFAEWQAEQARLPATRPTAIPTTTGPPISLELEVNEEFEAQQRARQQAEATERARQFRATYAKP
ncbi:hypothetical protein [Hymenobacter bucti]|uniref:Helix-turn-helix domain-containing protein n=1 Tax=Hymenobacter bucti TaxID=1844114 RepID=A0ABW4QXJ0_9BACT